MGWLCPRCGNENDFSRRQCLGCSQDAASLYRLKERFVSAAVYLRQRREYTLQTDVRVPRGTKWYCEKRRPVRRAAMIFGLALILACIGGGALAIKDAGTQWNAHPAVMRSLQVTNQPQIVRRLRNVIRQTNAKQEQKLLTDKTGRAKNNLQRIQSSRHVSAPVIPNQRALSPEVSRIQAEREASMNNSLRKAHQNSANQPLSPEILWQTFLSLLKQ